MRGIDQKARLRSQQHIEHLVAAVWPQVVSELEQRQMRTEESWVVITDDGVNPMALLIGPAGVAAFEPLEQTLPESTRVAFRRWREQPAAGMVRVWVAAQVAQGSLVYAGLRVALSGAPVA